MSKYEIKGKIAIVYEKYEYEALPFGKRINTKINADCIFTNDPIKRQLTLTYANESSTTTETLKYIEKKVMELYYEDLIINKPW